MSTSSPTDSLKTEMAALKNKLEDDPDPWFVYPRGYLKKPPYKRAAQDRSAILKKTNFSNILGSGYLVRFFALDIKGQKLMYFKNDDPNTVEKGHVDMKKILDISYSQVFDAPPNSLDLISRDRHYTIVCESKEQVVRWAVAFSLACPIPQIVPALPFDIDFYDKNFHPEEKNDTLPFRWAEFEIIFPKQIPLMMNVVGMFNRDKDGKLVNYLLSVTSFDFYPDGTSGAVESTGMVGVKDYLIKVNNTDLTKLPTSEAMNAFLFASWPRTLYFLRDNLGVKDGPRVEGWAGVNYPTLQRRRLRYCELIHDTINFYRAEPGGTVGSQKDTSFNIKQILEIRPIVNLTLSSYPCSLIIKCRQNSLIYHYKAPDDALIGGTRVDILELHFHKLRQLNRWRSALVSPVLMSDGSLITHRSIPVETITT